MIGGADAAGGIGCDRDPPAPTIVRDTAVLKGWINVRRIEIGLPDGTVIERHMEDHGPGVAVLPYNAARRTALLISQPRAPVLLDDGGDVLEAIAGRLDGADAADRVRQEALEEAGVALDRLEIVVRLWSMPSISTERLFLYLAPYSAASRIAAGGGCPDEQENIRVHEIALRDLAEMALAGRLTDAKTLILVQALQLRRPDLFG